MSEAEYQALVCECTAIHGKRVGAPGRCTECGQGREIWEGSKAEILKAIMERGLLEPIRNFETLPERAQTTLWWHDWHKHLTPGGEIDFISAIAAECGWNPLRPGGEMTVHYGSKEYIIKCKERA